MSNEENKNNENIEYKNNFTEKLIEENNETHLVKVIDPYSERLSTSVKDHKNSLDNNTVN